MLQQGIGLGIQPVVSFLHGAGDTERREKIARYGVISAVLIGAGGLLLSAGGYRLIPALFNASGDVVAVAGRGLIISAAVYPFLGLQKVSEAYFQAMDRPGMASLLVYLDCFLVLPLSLLLLPLWAGADGIWGGHAGIEASDVRRRAAALLPQRAGSCGGKARIPARNGRTRLCFRGKTVI